MQQTVKWKPYTHKAKKSVVINNDDVITNYSLYIRYEGNIKTISTTIWIELRKQSGNELFQILTPHWDILKCKCGNVTAEEAIEILTSIGIENSENAIESIINKSNDIVSDSIKNEGKVFKSEYTKKLEIQIKADEEEAARLLAEESNNDEDYNDDSEEESYEIDEKDLELDDDDDDDDDDDSNDDDN